MTEKTAKICCMFRQEDADLAVQNRDLACLEVLRESSRRSRVLCRCRRCGGAVLYDYEEIANLYGGWDNADVFEHWYPVEIPEAASGEAQEEINWRIIKGAGSICGHNLQDDAVFRYSFQEN